MSIWKPFIPGAIKDPEAGTFIVVARPDGKSWSGVIQTSTQRYVILRNVNKSTELHFDLNPTASFTILEPPRWEIRFGQPRLL